MVPLTVAMFVAVVFACVAVSGVGFSRLLTPRWQLPADFDLIAAFAFLATMGYIVFWIYLLDPRAGDVAVTAFWGLIVLLLVRHIRDRDRRRPSVELRITLAVTLTAALMYVSILLLFRRPEPAEVLAAHRFTSGQLPGDNIIPRLFADRLLNGLSPRLLIGDWLSSDRPPLATGWILLFQRPLEFLGASRPDAYFVGAVTFQMSWIAGLWSVLRACRASFTAAAVAVAFTVCTSVTLINSVFTWPKLSAAAFMLAAWAVILGGGQRTPLVRGAWCGVLMALAMLSHGAASFAVLATAIVLFVGWIRHRDKQQAIGAVLASIVGLALYVPWMAYQRWYEPPGDRLVKWHLAGVIPIDDRSVGEALVDQYGALTVGEWIDLKWSNIHILYHGLLDGSRFVMPSVETRTPEFYFLLTGIGLAGFLWLALPLVPILRRTSSSMARAWSDSRRLVWFTLATLTVSILLSFGPMGTTIHQMSYVIPVTMAALPIAVVSSIRLKAGIGLLALQWAWFLTTWIPAPSGWSGPVSWGALTLLVVSQFGLVGSIVWCWRSESGARRAPSLDVVEPVGLVPDAHEVV